MVSRSRRLRFWLIVLVVTLMLGAGAYFVWTSLQPHYDNVSGVARVSGLTLVLPRPLSHDSLVTHQPSYDKASGAIFTRISIQGIEVTFSQQKRPKTDLKQVDAQDTFLVNVGSVYILKGEEGRLQAIVETSDSWLMVNADAKIGVNIFKEVLGSLDAI